MGFLRRDRQEPKSSSPTAHVEAPFTRLETPRAVVGPEEEEETPDPWRADLTNPLDRAGWLSQLTMWWVNAAIKRGYARPLEQEDVWLLPTADRAATLQRAFDDHYADTKARHRARRRPHRPLRIYGPLWRSTKATMGVAAGLSLLSTLTTLVQPHLIKALLQFLQGTPNLFGLDSGYGLAGLLTATAFVGVSAMDLAMFLTCRCGINARTIIVNGVYQKMLRLSSTARRTMNTGDIITLASVDSERVFEGFAIGLWTLQAPLVAATICVLIAVEMGWSVGLAASVSCAAILTYAITNAREIGRIRRRILQLSGERVKVTNEVLQGIRVVKMYAWEEAMAARVGEVRAREIALLRTYSYKRANNFVILTMGQLFMTVACLVVYVYEGHALDVPTAFVLLALVNSCRVPFSIFSNAVVYTSEGWASLQRVSKFLGDDEYERALDDAAAEPLLPGQPVIEIHDAAFTWLNSAAEGGDSDAGSVSAEELEAETIARPILRNLNLTIAPGSLTIVVGAVGSGKSSLVSAMLGEMHQLRGSCVVRGAIAYASQQAWIQHNTVRENILFGAPFDAEHYQRVIAACQLTRDLEILENGDATEIGERGINLSGGQKARVSLARVMYRRESDLVVLDDPLSALDVHVANAVFFECVAGLAKSKTRLLVLNAHYHLLKHADRILVLADGEIVGDGTYEEVKETFEYLEDQAHEKVMMTADEDIHTVEEVLDAMVTPESQTEETSRPSNCTGDEESRAKGDSQVTVTVPSATRCISTREQAEKSQKRLVTDEDRTIGSITWRTYASFLSCSGWNGATLGIVILGAFAIAQCGLLGTDYFLTFWSDDVFHHTSEKTLLWIFVGIVAGTTFFSVLRALFFTEICVQCSKALHARYFHRVLLAPVTTFFDVTPVGRVLNRFSRDLDQIDNALPYFTLAFLIYFFLTLAIFIVCAVTAWTTLLLYAPVMYGSYWIQQYYLASSRELKRLDGVTRSPFLNLLSETLNGIETIRSYRMTEQFSRKCQDLLDYNAKFYFMFQAVSKWQKLRLDWVVTTVVTTVAFTCVASKNSIGAAAAGIALTYAVQITMQFQRLLTLSGMTENFMTSYERIAHYGTLDEEGHTQEIVVQPAAEWPVRGVIEFRNVHLRYRDGLDYVLRGVTFSIRDGEKVGVCGRTGSGKSTLMNALIRTVEAAEGSVFIDGVNIASIKVQTLRSRLTIIPQDPVLFSGTLRANLDPFDERTDDELFAALRKVHLIEDVGRWGQGLSYPVSEKGDNLSVGQRQLLCIARALLRDSRIIVLDEATANVDQELDRLIQVTVKESFVGRTALTIAHRLETIADSDRILVMEQGRVAEFDSPANLLAKTDGIFASLMHGTKHT